MNLSVPGTEVVARRRAESVKAMSGLLALLFTKLPANGVNFAVAVAMARFVTPAEQGTYALALFWVVIGSTLLGFGVNEALLYDRAEAEAIAAHAVVRISTASILMVVTILAAVALPVSSDVRVLLPVVALGQAAALVYTTPKVILEYEQRVPVLAALELAGVCIGAGIGIFIAVNSGGAWALAWQLVASNGFVLLGSLLVARHRFTVRATARGVIEAMRRFGIPLWFGGAASALLTFGVPLAALLGGRVGAGVYSKAETLVMTFGPVASGAVVRLVVPLFGRRRDDRAGLATLVTTVLAAKVRLLLPGYLVVAATAPLWLVPVLGSEWAAALVPFQLLTIYIGAKLFLDDLAYLPSVAAGRPWVTIVLQVCWAVATVALMGVLGVVFGVPGVAAGMTLGTVGAAVGITAWSGRYLSVSMASPAASVLCYVVGFAAVALVVPSLQPYGPIVATIMVLASAGLMVGILGRPVATLRLALGLLTGPRRVD